MSTPTLEPWELRAFEELRSGLLQAYMRGAEHKDKVLMACMRAHYDAANRSIAKLGGGTFPLPNLEAYVERNTP